MRIAAFAKHAHKAFGRFMRSFAELLKTDRRVDVIAKDSLAGLDIARKKAIHGLADKALAELGIPLHPCLKRFFEISCQRRSPVPPGALRSLDMLAGENLASPTGFELESTKNDGDGEDAEVFDIWKLKRSGG